MKKLFLFLAIATLAFVSCSKDDDAPIDFNKTSLSLYANQTHQLFKGTVDDVSSSSKFVATASKSGLVTANHVGTATISSGSSKCLVTVIPRYTLYPDPYMNWGASKATVRANIGTPIQETATILGYLSASKTILTMYQFESGVLSSVAVAFINYFPSNLFEFLSERYQMFYVDPNDSIIAAFTDEKIGVYVYLDKSAYMVIYAPLSSTRSSYNNIKELIEETKRQENQS